MYMPAPIQVGSPSATTVNLKELVDATSSENLKHTEAMKTHPTWSRTIQMQGGLSERRRNEIV